MRSLAPKILERLIYGGGGARRFTQDSPVLPDVWIRFGAEPGKPQDLLLTPHHRSSAGRLAWRLRRYLDQERGSRILRIRDGSSLDPEVAYTQSFVAARLYLDDVVRVLLPMTGWWHDYVWRARRQLGDPTQGTRLDPEQLRDPKLRGHLVAALEAYGRAADSEGPAVVERRERGEGPAVPTDLAWMMRIVGTLMWAQSASPMEKAEKEGADRLPSASEMVDAILVLLADMPQAEESERGPVGDLIDEQDDRICLWLVSRNRPASPAVQRSSLAIKADAARLLFKISCRDLTWAVVDSGIDASHPAFLDEPRKDAAGNPIEKPWHERTRIRATYDFTRVRILLNPSHLTPRNKKLPPAVRALLERNDDRGKALKKQLKELRLRLQRGRDVDWELLDPFLRVPHDGDDLYQPPSSEHGTHVAGVLGAHWKFDNEDPLLGVCPDIRLYDLRVLDPDGPNDEFAVLAALQFIDHLNSKKDFLVIHGANLSLSIRHDVANYACGRTPVCDECERLVAAGVVVVAAAGNAGYLRYETADGPQDGYNTVSITDPGNAEGVITVGATHRYRPHTFGVSYFSSRGPTGDGRLKPDLVAPGEKITSVVPDGGQRRMDGTSMAAPHVSGAAALLMARHGELVGNPVRIKEVLCESATDLGRERYFQGRGMLDVLRALQSV